SQALHGCPGGNGHEGPRTRRDPREELAGSRAGQSGPEPGPGRGAGAGGEGPGRGEGRRDQCDDRGEAAVEPGGQGGDRGPGAEAAHQGGGGAAAAVNAAGGGTATRPESGGPREAGQAQGA